MKNKKRYYIYLISASYQSKTFPYSLIWSNMQNKMLIKN